MNYTHSYLSSYFCYKMLVAMKKRLALTDCARKLEVVRKYNKLKTYSQ
jgi:hypothetical protein